MTAATSKQSAKRKRKPRRPQVETIYYVLEIADWEWSFMFVANAAPDRDGPYSDYRHLQLRGKMLQPSKIKADTAELVFLPDRQLNEGGPVRGRPIGLGSLKLHRGHLQGIFPMPSDVLPLLLTMLTAEKLRYVMMNGAKMRYGNARIQSFRMEMSIDEDDFPPEA